MTGLYPVVRFDLWLRRVRGLFSLVCASAAARANGIRQLRRLWATGLQRWLQGFRSHRRRSQPMLVAAVR